MIVFHMRLLNVTCIHLILSFWISMMGNHWMVSISRVLVFVFIRVMWLVVIITILIICVIFVVVWVFIMWLHI